MGQIENKFDKIKFIRNVLSMNMKNVSQIKQINDALKKSGLKRSEVREYVTIDEYLNKRTFKPRTQKLRWELDILFLDDDSSDYEIREVYVNALHQVVIEYASQW